MADPFEIHVAGRKFTGWTKATLKRQRDALTGSLTVDCFYGSTPTTPVIREVKAGAKIEVKVAGRIAFTGSIDKRAAKGSGKKGKKGNSDGASDGGDASGGSASASIDKDSYTVTITARGKTKRLVDASHQHKTGTIRNTTPGEIVRELAKPFGVEVEDKANDKTKIERATFRDGHRVEREVSRWASEANLHAFETREGKLRIAKPGEEDRGVDLILGQRILSFSSEQSEDQSHSEVTVKGQRTDPKVHGKDAINRKVTAKLEGNGGGSAFNPLITQLAGDATDERLKARAKVEQRRREEAAAEITVEVFAVTQDGSPSGEPWDIAVRHYVEVPPENVFDDFVVTELTYEVSAGGDNGSASYKTTLELKPATKGEGSGRSDSEARGAARRASLGVKNEPTLYPDPWEIGSLIFS